MLPRFPGRSPASKKRSHRGTPQRSLWSRFRAWPLIAKIPAIGCAGLLGLFVLLLVIGIVGVALDPAGGDEPAAEDQATSAPETEEPSSASAAPEESESPEPTESDEPSEEPAESETPTPSPSPTPSPTPTPTASANPDENRAVVVRIVDGDTVELDNGDTVRVTGIDTPERGECNFDTASARMGELVRGKTVTLTRDGDDADRYDRILRYIDVGGTDAGMTLIEEGLATARYDSRDGYDFHTREPDYIAADNATALQGCAAEQAPAPEPAPAPAPAPAPEQQASNCDPNYTPCIPVYPPDVNCGDLSSAVRVIGTDVHGLDADGDGIGCDSNG
ncbi:thermonuclease family protein [Nesterenkonia sp. Act20]|uniref:thermonuclease family protein n=1 Tax=Nesterenkonia sp. Act20 TaxID=1483432 RepID=UPI001C4868BB|nr:thermonuclease family protein [Nesterenkonia sp. Act20]